MTSDDANAAVDAATGARTRVIARRDARRRRRAEDGVIATRTDGAWRARRAAGSGGRGMMM